MDTLVLNRNFLAFQIINWKKAMKLLCLGKANVVDDDCKSYNFYEWCELSQMLKNSKFVHTPTLKIAIPEVIILRFYDGYPTNGLKLTRKNIYEFYGYRCCYCGKKFPSSYLNIDHVIPKTRGGKDEWNNIVASCLSCNRKKGDRTPPEAGMELKIKPRQPNVYSKLQLIIRSPLKTKPSWQKFISHLHLNTALER